MRKYPLLLGCVYFLLMVSACTGKLSPAPVEATVIHTVVITQLAEIPVTVEVEVTRQIEVTRIIEIPVTITLTSTPIESPTTTNTPTITPTPTITLTPTNTPLPTTTPNLALTATIEAFGILASSKSDGFYTVGVDILAGKWRSNGTDIGCYWARRNDKQETIGNHFGLAGGTVNIRASDYEVEFKDCGTWLYVENEILALLPTARDPKEDGFYTVGLEIAPGKWKSTGSGDSCYWARLNGNQETLGNHFGNAGGTVTIRATDYEVSFADCGTWEYLGP
jgi:hypothetical protein